MESYANRFTFLLGMPVAERFTFVVTTLLTDVAANCESVREEVLNTQVEVLSALTNVIIRAAREDSLLSANGKSMWFAVAFI